MAKLSARDSAIYLDDSSGACKSVSADLSSVELTYSSENVDVTGFGSTVRERVHDIITDWSFSYNGFYNADADSVEELFLNDIKIGGSTFLRWGPSGSTATCAMYAGCAILQDCNVQSAFDGAVAISGTIIARTGSLTRTTASWA